MRSPKASVFALPCALWGQLSATRKAALKVSGSSVAGRRHSEAFSWRCIPAMVASWGLSDCARASSELAGQHCKAVSRAVSSSRGEVL